MQLNYHALKLLGWDNAPIYLCGCGNEACLDNYLSGRGFELLYRDLVGETIDAKTIDAKTIITRFYQNDEKTLKFVDLFIELMAISIGNLITILDPDLIVFGGGLSNFDHIYQALPAQLSKYIMRSAKVPEIKKAIHGDSGGVRGAAALFLS